MLSLQRAWYVTVVPEPQITKFLSKISLIRTKEEEEEGEEERKKERKEEEEEEEEQEERKKIKKKKEKKNEEEEKEEKEEESKPYCAVINTNKKSHLLNLRNFRESVFSRLKLTLGPSRISPDSHFNYVVAVNRNHQNRR